MKKQEVSIVSGVLAVEYPTIGKTFKVTLAQYPKSVYVECDASDHGMKQKFGDAASGKSPVEKFAEVQLIHASLLTGEWNRTANPVDRTPEILAAVAAVMGLKYNAEKGTLTDGKKSATPTEEQVKQWATDSKVKVKILEQRLEKSKKALAEAPKQELTIELK